MNIPLPQQLASEWLAGLPDLGSPPWTPSHSAWFQGYQQPPEILRDLLPLLSGVPDVPSAGEGGGG